MLQLHMLGVSIANDQRSITTIQRVFLLEAFAYYNEMVYEQAATTETKDEEKPKDVVKHPRKLHPKFQRKMSSHG